MASREEKEKALLLAKPVRDGRLRNLIASLLPVRTSGSRAAGQSQRVDRHSPGVPAQGNGLRPRNNLLGSLAELAEDQRLSETPWALDQQLARGRGGLQVAAGRIRGTLRTRYGPSSKARGKARGESSNRTGLRGRKPPGAGESFSHAAITTRLDTCHTGVHNATVKPPNHPLGRR
jgi:hypothetical protein